jgi:hypothetical protein
MVRELAIWLIAGTLAYCDCVGGLVAGNKKGSAAVFRGRVVAIEKLRKTPHGRDRYTVRFRVGEVWKGPTNAEFTLHTVSAGGDCRGFDFQLQQEYIVFAHEEVVSRNLALAARG